MADFFQVLESNEMKFLKFFLIHAFFSGFNYEVWKFAVFWNLIDKFLYILESKEMNVFKKFPVCGFYQCFKIWDMKFFSAFALESKAS